MTSEEASINFGMGAFYTAYLNQIQDDQQSDGAVTNFVPSLGTGDGAPNWQSVYPSIVHAMTMYFGDVQPVHDHLDSLRAYVVVFLLIFFPIFKHIDTQILQVLGNWIQHHGYEKFQKWIW